MNCDITDMTFMPNVESTRNFTQAARLVSTPYDSDQVFRLKPNSEVTNYLTNCHATDTSV